MQYEIEIKTLLGTKEAADALLERMQLQYQNIKQKGHGAQLNHYFQGGELTKLCQSVEHLLDEVNKQKLWKIAETATSYSLRARQTEQDLILVVKATADEHSSDNGLIRQEFEASLKSTGLTLEGLDKLILDAGFVYQAKWSRERVEYEFGDGYVLCLDKNAGYGYVAEFEAVVHEGEDVFMVRDELKKIMSSVEVDELDQGRLERMFAYYNANWHQYYGTNEVFEVM